ncbi:MAG: 5'-methylthioadenosine/S-adenosylhomocysteine nucleosidase [Spirochaetales bacterium]|nr:5'-methylthioadenosine/S-adenosylhomocysteine nucleosidase [Spirochaetales bacterium]
MKIVIITALKQEFSAAEKSFPFKVYRNGCGLNEGRCVIGNTEVVVVQSGVGKARAAAATAFTVSSEKPDMVIDTGCCGALRDNLKVGDIVCCLDCIEYDMAGTGFPVRYKKWMRLPSAFMLLDSKARRQLEEQAGKYGKCKLLPGNMASGEFVIKDASTRKNLAEKLKACACDWETAGVFISALLKSVPVLSFRIVTDMADAGAVVAFLVNVLPQGRALYTFLLRLMEGGWFARFLELFNSLDHSITGNMTQYVRKVPFYD